MKDRADEVKKETDSKLRELAETYITEHADYKKAMDDIAKSSQFLLVDAFKKGKEVVGELIDGIKDATSSEKEALKKIFGDFFDKGIKESTEGNYDGVSQMVGEFASLVDASFQFKDNLDGGLGTLSQM